MKELRTDLELLTAALFQVFVYVVNIYDPNDRTDFGGTIEGYTRSRVKVNDEWYIREDFSFYTML